MKETTHSTSPHEFQAVDEHDRRLLENVHPPAWRNPEPAARYHLVALGAGTAGLVSAIVTASLGGKAALVERHLMGGDCLNVGCVPSKALIASSRALRRRELDGALLPRIESDVFARAMERVRRLRADISPHDSARRFAEAGVDVFLGHGRFVARDALEVGGQRLRFRRAVIATGGRPVAPPIPGLEEAGYLTNETVFSLTKRPDRLLVIGAGPIGCELAQAFAGLGTRVVLLDVAEQVLGREDRQAAAIVASALERDGVGLRLGAQIEAVERRAGGEIVVRYTHRGARHETATDQILVAAGRRPNVEDLGLEAAGVELDENGVRVDDRLRTANPRIYAAGDVTPHPKFTHLADAHAGIVVQNALFFGRRKASSLVVPWCTYTTPEVAHVGLYEHEAKERGVAVQVVQVPLSANDRAVLDGENEGFVKLVLAKGKDRILGATVVAHHAGDLVAPLCLATTHRIGLAEFAATIFPYPTQAEAIKKAANQWRKGKLSPVVQSLFRRWFGLWA